MLENLDSKDIFNSKNYFNEVHGVRVYVTEDVDTGQVIYGKTFEEKIKTQGLFREIGGKPGINLGNLKKITHLAVHPKTVKSLLAEIEGEYAKQRN